MRKPTEVKDLSNGRTAFWDDASQTVVIRHPKGPDGGTAFKPRDRQEYFTGLQ
jgi:hypothetical protein